jgi:hypothetical protein
MENVDRPGARDGRNRQGLTQNHRSRTDTNDRLLKSGESACTEHHGTVSHAETSSTLNRGPLPSPYYRPGCRRPDLLGTHRLLFHPSSNAPGDLRFASSGPGKLLRSSIGCVPPDGAISTKGRTRSWSLERLLAYPTAFDYRLVADAFGGEKVTVRTFRNVLAAITFNAHDSRGLLNCDHPLNDELVPLIVAAREG